MSRNKNGTEHIKTRWDSHLDEMDRNSIKKYVLDHIKPSVKKKLSLKEIDDSIDEAIKFCINPMTVSTIFVMDSFDLFCEKCGQCCRQSDPIRIQDEEIPIYSQQFGRNFDTYFICRDGKWYFKKTKPCAFLASTGRCNIYEMRPVVCRSYPFNNLDKIEINTKCKVPMNMAKHQAISIIVWKIMDKEHPEVKTELQKIFKVDEEAFKKMTPEQQLRVGIVMNKLIKNQMK